VKIQESPYEEGDLNRQRCKPNTICIALPVVPNTIIASNVVRCNNYEIVANSFATIDLDASDTSIIVLPNFSGNRRSPSELVVRRLQGTEALLSNSAGLCSNETTGEVSSVADLTPLQDLRLMYLAEFAHIDDSYLDDILNDEIRIQHTRNIPHHYEIKYCVFAVVIFACIFIFLYVFICLHIR
jgi:hypothetical protein